MNSTKLIFALGFSLAALLLAPGCGNGASQTLDQPMFADGEAVAVVKQWLINADCIAYYHEADDWRNDYLGGGVWQVVARISETESSEWQVYERTATVNPVNSNFVGIC